MNIEEIYLKRIAEIVVGSEQRAAALQMEIHRLRERITSLETENAELQGTTRDLALQQFASAHVEGEVDVVPEHN